MSDGSTTNTRISTRVNTNSLNIVPQAVVTCEIKLK